MILNGTKVEVTHVYYNQPEEYVGRIGTIVDFSEGGTDWSGRDTEDKYLITFGDESFIWIPLIFFRVLWDLMPSNNPKISLQIDRDEQYYMSCTFYKNGNKLVYKINNTMYDCRIYVHRKFNEIEFEGFNPVLIDSTDIADCLMLIRDLAEELNIKGYKVDGNHVGRDCWYSLFGNDIV